MNENCNNAYIKTKEITTTPIVSIVTTSYNYEKYIKETIGSVINQTYTNWEMIIVDDGSKDNSINLINEYCQKDNRIKLYTHPNNENKGLAASVQLGIKKASANWIIFLESDDTITPNYIEEKMKILENYPDVKFIYNDVNMFGDQNCIEIYNQYFSQLYAILKSKTYPCNMLTYFKDFNIVPTFSCVMLHKEILNDIKWNTIHKPALDYYLWTQIAINYDFYFLDEKLTNWRMHQNSYINKKYSQYTDLYFSDVIIANIIASKNRYFSFFIKLRNIIKFLKKIFKIYRKKIIIIHLNSHEQKILLFGKTLFDSTVNKNSEQYIKEGE